MPSASEVFGPVFLIRTAIGLVLTAATVVGGTWFAISQATSGFEAATATLTSSVSDLSGRLQSESEQLREEKDSLAQDIAGRVVAAQSSQDARANELAAGIRDLTTQLRDTTTTLAGLSESVAGLNKSIQDVDIKVSNSITRQEGFEKFVVGILLQTTPPAIKPQSEITKNWGVDENVYQNIVLPNSEGKWIGNWLKATGAQ